MTQKARVREAPQVDMPGQVDSNSPAYWRDGELHLLNSTGNGPVLSRGPNQFHLNVAQASIMNRIQPWPTWIESIWADTESALLFGWYHRERFGLCPGTNLSVPQIGAAISFDGGETFLDMGTVVSDANPPDCSSQNGFFAGGAGDLSVILDRDKNYFYMFFGVYGGPVENQGVAVARLPFASRFSQAYAWMKWKDGNWTEPGINGRATPILPAQASWQRPDTDSFWGPAIHWNTYLNSYVMLLNHSCCSPGWTQEGIYVSFSGKIDDPASWSKPDKILEDTGWYPQVMGFGPDGTDRQAGRLARLYIYGHSRWDILFDKPAPASPTPPPPEQ